MEDVQAAVIVSPKYSRPMRTDGIDLGQFPVQDVKRVAKTGRHGALQHPTSRYVPRGRVPDELSIATCSRIATEWKSTGLDANVKHPRRVNMTYST